MKKVRAESLYYFSPNLLDKVDGRTDLVEGETVRVVNLPGCPPANTMDHAHVNRVNGKFAGLVHVNSLLTKAEYVEYLKLRIAAIERDRTVETKHEGWRNPYEEKMYE